MRGGTPYRIVIRFGGQYGIEAGPMKRERAPGPQSRESQDATRLSPIIKYCPGSSFGHLSVCWSRSDAGTYGSASRLPLTNTKPLRSDTVSPGNPITRLMKISEPLSPQSAAAAGAGETAISPRGGSRERETIRRAITPAEERGRRPPAGFAPWRGGSRGG